MVRIGQNPAKFMQDVPQPARITVVVVVYIPFLGGYYQESLNVLKLVLNSIWKNTTVEYDLMVFDNASCTEVRQYLAEMQAQEKIQFLILSDTNIGKAGAWNVAFNAAPGEFIAYADADVYHYPGWLKVQVDTLETFPQAGMVTGLPMLTPMQYSSATITWAEKTPGVDYQIGRFLSWEDFWRHALSLGGDEEKACKFFEENQDHCVVYQGKRYYIGASHFQFVTRKKVLQEVLPIPSNRPMGEVRLLDEAINQKGYLRLCLDHWYNQHMGNTLPAAGFLLEDDLINQEKQAEAPVKSTVGFWTNSLTRKIVQKIYDLSFEILYKK
ncbi:MAG: glycosyltransferase family 2 protein [Anaerolineales bacterium]|nr:glycosyltransferase family 2 protein [Anaerolineales bacterium]